jgi:ribosomal RNA-processing protein 7
VGTRKFNLGVYIDVTFLFGDSAVELRAVQVRTHPSCMSAFQSTSLRSERPIIVFIPPTMKTPLIKGYLPLRVRLPSNRETFLFIKQHHTSNSFLDQVDVTNALFVCNAPFVSDIRTTVFLTALFSKFGPVQQVTVVRNPRKITTTNLSNNPEKLYSEVSGQRWQEIISKAESIFPEYDANDEGKFALVCFSSSADMKNTLRMLQNIYKGTKDAGVNISSSELQSMVAQSNNSQGYKGNGADCSSNESRNGMSKERSQDRVLSLADRYRAIIIPRDTLMECCNAVMESFESAEEKARINSRLLSEPDEDGFITVSHSMPSKMVGSKRELEVGGGVITHADMVDEKRNGHTNKKARTRKKNTGASELTDFYRFQRREIRQKGVHELRKRFEDDLEAVKKVKEQKLYRAFESS